jgi:GNAT superfamily N-acetyltransferase
MSEIYFVSTTDITLVPLDYIMAMRDHYKEVFYGDWQEVWDRTEMVYEGETFYGLYDEDEDNALVGGFFLLPRKFDLRLRGFMIFKEYQQRGYAAEMLKKIREEAEACLREKWYREMPVHTAIVSTLAYPENSPFARFCRAKGFGEFPAMEPDTEAEKWAVENTHYKNADLRTFRWCVADEGTVLPKKVRDELRVLSIQQHVLVAQGLTKKLAFFRRSGRVSYSYKHCPVCNDVGLLGGEKGDCSKCYIPVTCQLPFEMGFEDDHLIGAAYWYAVRQYLLNLGEGP